MRRASCMLLVMIVPRLAWIAHAQVRVLEEADQVRRGGLPEREHGGALEADVRLGLLREIA